MNPPAALRPIRGPRFLRGHAVLTVVGVLALLALMAFIADESLYLSIARPVEGSAAAPTVGVVAEFGPLALVGITGLLVIWAWLNDRRAFWVLAASGVGVIVAYLTGEGLKLLVAEPRPCQVLDAATVASCPPAGDWSWPSNHAVLAAAFATACVLAMPRVIWLVAPVALAIAVSRVAAGVHYVHDIASGLALGVLVVVVIAMILLPLTDRLPQQLTSTEPLRGRP